MRPTYIILLPLLILIWPCSLYAQGDQDPVDRTLPIRLEDPEQRLIDPAQYLLFTPVNAYPSPFSEMSRYNFSFVRYQPRGYDYGHAKTTLNGIDLGNPITDDNNWNTLAALNNIPRVRIAAEGLRPVSSHIGTLGGVEEITANALALPMEARAAYVLTDRKYRQGLRAGISTGRLKGGWAFAFMGTHRWGYDRHLNGVFADNSSIYASIEKEFTPKHSLALTFIYAPMQQGARGATVTEVFELTGDRLYNPYWGFQNGKLRNSRVRTDKQPVALLTYTARPTAHLHITSSFAFQWGETGYSALDWMGAQNPNPDYYKKLPSSIANPDVAAKLTQNWQANNTQITQVDWDEMRYVNRHLGSNPAPYFVSNHIAESRNFQWATILRYEVSPLLTLSGGLRLRADCAVQYKRLDDLLGGEYLLDIDQFLVDDEQFGDKLENNVAQRGRPLTEGDRFGYHYTMYRTSAEGWGLLEWNDTRSRGRLSGYFGIQASSSTLQRDGQYEKELFPANASLGRSRPIHITPYMAKLGLNYLISARHFLRMELAAGEMAPKTDNLFLSPRYQNKIMDEHRPIVLYSSELAYRLTLGPVEGEVRGFITYTHNETEIRAFYDDPTRQYVNMSLSRIEKLRKGVELSLLVNFTPRITWRTVAAQGSYLYASDPNLQLAADRDGKLLLNKAKAYIKGFRLSGSPQRTVASELRYSGAQLWMVSLSANYVGDNYISINPAQRTKRYYDLATSPEAMSALADQERFADAVTFNIFASKSFRIRSHYLTISASVNNVANKQDIIYSGYEQTRITRAGMGANQTVTPFPAKYLYAYGRTFHLTLNFKY